MFVQLANFFQSYEFTYWLNLSGARVQLNFGLRTYFDQSMYLVGLNFGLSKFLDHIFGLDFRLAKSLHFLA